MCLKMKGKRVQSSRNTTQHWGKVTGSHLSLLSSCTVSLFPFLWSAVFYCTPLHLSCFLQHLSQSQWKPWPLTRSICGANSSNNSFTRVIESVLGSDQLRSTKDKMKTCPTVTRVNEWSPWQQQHWLHFTMSVQVLEWIKCKCFA